MLINKMILDNLYQDAGKDKIEEIEKYNKNSKIDIKEFNYKNDCNFEVRAIVVDKEKYNVYIEVKEGEIEDIVCNCKEYYKTYSVCKHTLATILYLNDNEEYIKKYGINSEK